MYFPDGVRTPLTPLVWLRHCLFVLVATVTLQYDSADRDVFWGQTRFGPKNHVLNDGPDTPDGKGRFRHRQLPTPSGQWTRPVFVPDHPPDVINSTLQGCHDADCRYQFSVAS